MSQFGGGSPLEVRGGARAAPQDATAWALPTGAGEAAHVPAPVAPSAALTAAAARVGVSPIVARGAEAWLDNEEVYELLRNFSAHGLTVSSKPIQNPPSGTLFIYDRSVTRNFRQDGVRYIMRTDRPQSAKESNMKLKVNDVKVMNVSYASCPPQGSHGSQDGDEDVVFRRRVYSLWPKRAGSGPDYVLVHYLREKAGSKARRSSVTRSHAPAHQPSAPQRAVQMELQASPPVARHAPPGVPLTIIEFSPNWDTSRGGAKILVCLSGDPDTLQRLHSKELPAQCQFGALTVPAECLAPGVLRCIAPMHTAGTVPFSVALDNHPVSEYKRFEYRPPAVAHMPKPSAFGRFGSNSSSSQSGAGARDFSSSASTQHFHNQSNGSMTGFSGQSDLLELLLGSGPRDSMTDLMLDDDALSVSPSGLSIDAELAADIDMNVNGSPGGFLSPFGADAPSQVTQTGFAPSASAAALDRAAAAASSAAASSAAAVAPLATATDAASSVAQPAAAVVQPGMAFPLPGTWGSGASAPAADASFTGAGAGAGAGAGGRPHGASNAQPRFPAPFPSSTPSQRPPERDVAMGRPKGRPRDAAAVRAARVRAREEPHRDRETKIRIVERLGRVENSLSNHQRQGGAQDGGASAGVAADGFLDDAALEGMSDEKLQTLTEQLLEHVINELTKHASEEEALMQELITSDVNGMTMLHYTCMYNYPRLVPVLLANGADPNKPTAAGQSPLHLAASHGQWDIVAQLIHAGASALARDKSGLTPHMRAYRNGHKALGARLQSIALRQAHLAGLTVESGTTEGFGTPARMKRISPTNAVGATPPTPPSSSGASVSGSTPPLPPSSASRNAARASGIALLGDAMAAAAAGIAGPASGPRTLSRTSSGGDGGKSEEDEEEEEETRKLLLNAFSNMTLHDKCAISLVMGRDKDIAGGSDAGAGLTDDLFGGVGGLRDTDVASVLSDNDASLIQAMSLMSDEEQLSLEADARRIQTNVRSWLLRRNYRSMRDAARKLQAATRGMLARKNFEVHKHKAFAALVIQRATRSWLKSFGDVAATRSAHKTSSHGSLHPVPEE